MPPATGTKSPAVEALGLGAVLADQVRDETDEARRKRMALGGGLQGIASRDLLGAGLDGIGGFGAAGF